MLESVETGSTTRLAALVKCAHPACTCTVTGGSQFCSDVCAERMLGESGTTGEACDCGHRECAHAIGISPHVGAVPA